MINTPVQRLIERAIDSPLKLQLLLLFTEHKQFSGTTSEIAARAFRDIWSTREALRELAEDGILVSCTGNDPVYSYHPRPELLDAIRHLYQIYNEPTERDQIQRLVRDVAIFAPYRRSGVHEYAYE